MSKQRICVVCGDVLTDQRTWHTSSKAKKTKWGQTKYCHGPSKTPGIVSRIRLAPVHFRDFASPGSITVCCLIGGRTKGKYKDAEADVSYGRIKVDLTQTTCEHCLVAIIKRCKQKLRDRLKATGKTALTAFREQRQVAVVQGLKQLVNA